MTEFRKILRYLIPIFVLILYVHIFTALPYFLDAHLEAVLSDFKFDSTLLMGLLLGLGFLLSTIHHLLFNSERVSSLYPRPEYKAFMESSQIKDSLKVMEPNQTPLNNLQIWRVINVIWHRLRIEDPAMEKINERNDSLTDLVHSTGTTYLAFFLSVMGSAALIIYFAFCAENIVRPNLICLGLDAVVIILLFFLHRASYTHSVQNLQEFVKIALLDALVKKQKKGLLRKDIFTLNLPKN